MASGIRSAPVPGTGITAVRPPPASRCMRGLPPSIRWTPGSRSRRGCRGSGRPSRARRRGYPTPPKPPVIIGFLGRIREDAVRLANLLEVSLRYSYSALRLPGMSVWMPYEGKPTVCPLDLIPGCRFQDAEYLVVVLHSVQSVSCVSPLMSRIRSIPRSKPDRPYQIVRSTTMSVPCSPERASRLIQFPLSSSWYR